MDRGVAEDSKIEELEEVLEEEEWCDKVATDSEEYGMKIFLLFFCYLFINFMFRCGTVSTQKIHDYDEKGH